MDRLVREPGGVIIAARRQVKGGSVGIRLSAENCRKNKERLLPTTGNCNCRWTDEALTSTME
jgi:hypothetical protein